MGALVKDPIRTADRAEVYERDKGCIAPLVDPDAGPCRTITGRVIDRRDKRFREVDHVPPETGARHISKPRWMVWLCQWHHRGMRAGRVWATSHRQEERDYLARKYGETLSNA